MADAPEADLRASFSEYLIENPSQFVSEIGGAAGLVLGASGKELQYISWLIIVQSYFNCENIGRSHHNRKDTAQKF